MTRIILQSEEPKPEVQEEPALSVYEDLSVDEELKKGLLAINRLMKQILSEIRSGEIANRDLVSNLKACMDMLRDLKKSEKEILENLNDEELQKKLKDT